MLKVAARKCVIIYTGKFLLYTLKIPIRVRGKIYHLKSYVFSLQPALKNHIVMYVSDKNPFLEIYFLP